MSRASEPAPIKPLAEGELREAVARIVRGWSLPPEGQRIGPGTKRAIEEADAKAAEILAALPIQPSRPQGEEGLDRDELTDLISDAISDSMDMDWQSRDGARAVVAALVKENIVKVAE